MKEGRWSVARARGMVCPEDRISMGLCGGTPQMHFGAGGRNNIQKILE